MKSKRVAEDTHVLVFEQGDEVMAELQRFVKENDVGAAHFTGIGGFSSVTLGYFERARLDYRPIPLEEQVELLSILGDVAIAEDGPKVHAHVVVGKRDGTAYGGHLLRGRVWPTLEVVLTGSPAELRKSHDPETGLALIDLR